MGPVRNSPAGTTTRPPPAWAQASIALRMASVQSAWPAAVPKSVIGNWRAGNTGALMRERISGTRAHPDEIKGFAVAGAAASSWLAAVGTPAWLLKARPIAGGPTSQARNKVRAVLRIPQVANHWPMVCSGFYRL